MSYDPQKVAIYCQGTFDLSPTSSGNKLQMLASANELSGSGFGTIILGQWHVHSDGGIFYNGLPLNLASWALNNIPMALKKGGSVKKVLITFGPFGSDFAGIQANLASFKQQMAGVLALPGIDGLDWDIEGDYDDYTSLLEDLTSWTTAQNKMVTAAPYWAPVEQFWVNLLQNTNGNNQQGFSWWNLQLYGGAVYSDWVGYINGLVPDIPSFLLPGYFANASNPAPGITADLQALQQQYPTVDGAFLWRYEDIVGQAKDYAQAIIAGLT